MRRKDQPGMLLQIRRARENVVDFLQRFEFEIAAESTPRHLKNVAVACELLLEKLIRIQGHETLETRGFENALADLVEKGRRLWEVERPSSPPRLSVVPRLQ